MDVKMDPNYEKALLLQINLYEEEIRAKCYVG